MNPTDYTFLLNKPDAVNDKQTVALGEIVREFPFFQSARALQLKGLYNQNSFQYNQSLKITAAYTTDRSVLFDFITSDTFTAIHKGLYEKKLAELYGIEVRGSEIVESTKEASGITKVEESLLISIRESESDEPAKDEIEAQTTLSEAIETKTEEISKTETHSLVEITAEVLSIPETPEEKLEIGKPLEFSSNEKHSFQEWLQLSSLKQINREEIVVETEEESPSPAELEKNKKKALIDQFIKSNPKIPPVKHQTPQIAIPEPTKEDNSALMTETLARVYLEQKKYQKAIQAYEILILKYPEKITFFADRISEIKNLQQNT